ncbi:MAG: redoxin domain-containing protein [Sphingomicrobium sp.]
MRRLINFALAATATATLAVPANAALTVGAIAPDFQTTGAIAGKAFKLHLADQLKKGPVVLYFFPKAFTGGCTAEAHAFSEATAEFRKAGAGVIGMSADDLPTLQRFSVEACRNAFPVATASPATIKAYDVKLPLMSMTNRTSYVIARDGRITMVHSEMSWKDHVAKSLAAVQALQK